MDKKPSIIESMIYFYFGEDDFGIKRQVDNLKVEFTKKYGTESVTKINASNINPQKLIAEIINVNLFAPKRLIFLYGASENKVVWQILGDNLSRVPNETGLVIIELSPDKRTKTFKELLKTAKIREFKLPKNQNLIEFVLKEAADNKIEIKRSAVNELIIFTGGDPWRITSEIAKFKLLDKVVTTEMVQVLVEPEIEASAYKLLDDLLSGRRGKALTELQRLRQLEEPQKFLGLLASQVFALAVAVNADGTANTLASEFGVNPYVMSKISAAAHRINKEEVKKIAKIIAETDAKSKSSGTDPWILIELAISKI